MIIITTVRPQLIVVSIYIGIRFLQTCELELYI